MNKSLFTRTLIGFLILISNSVTTKLYSQIQGTGIFFQAVARDNFSNPAKDRKIYIQSTIIQYTENGTKVLIEEHQSQTDQTGVFGISIGQGIRKGGTASNLASIEWAKGPYFLNLKVSIQPIAPFVSWDYTKELIDLGTTPFGTVPYALYAANSGALDSKLSIADTSKMLALYAKAQAVQTLSSAVSTKISTTDTAAMLAPYSKMVAALVSSNITSLTAAAINAGLDAKVNVADSGVKYVTPQQLRGVKFDTTSLIAKVDTKVSIADSGVRYVTPQQLKGVKFDTTSLIASVDKKLSISDSINKYVTPAQLSSKTFDTTSLSNRINLKVSTTDMTSGLALKFNKTDTSYLLQKVDTATLSTRINLKANTTDLTTGLALKANVTDVTSGLALKANVTDVTTSLALKANATDLTTGLALKANATDVTTSLALKANATDVTTSLALKANATDLTTGLALKANATDVTTGLALKANATDVTTSLALKANATDVTTSLALKANTTDVNTSLALKLDASQKGAANGIPTLDNSSKIPAAQIPVVSFQSANVVATQTAMLALSSAVVGSIAIRTDNNRNYVLSGTDPSILLNWVELAVPNSVTTINGIPGAFVTLTTDEIGEGANNKYYTNSRVRSALSASSPLSYNVATGTLSMTAATTSANGYLTSSDFTTFNNKQNTLVAGTDYATPAQITLSSLGAEASANKSNDIATDAASTTKFPTVKSIKDYVDQQSANAGVADNSITSSKINGTIAVTKGGTGATTAAAARTNLGLVIGTDVMAATAATTLTGDVLGSGNGSFATTVNSVGGVSSSTIATLPTSVAAHTVSITSNATAITSEAATARAAEQALTTSVNSNTASITSNATAITSEAATARAAEQALTTSVNANTASITSNATAITSEAATARAAEQTLTTSVNANTASITSNATAITSEAATARAAEQALTTSVNANTASITSNTNSINSLSTSVNANTASITSNATAITSEAATARAAEQTLTNNLSSLTTTVNANTASITSNTNSISGLTTSVNANTASITSNTNSINSLSTSVNANTASITSNTNSIATNTADILLKAAIASPTFTGTPSAPTPATSDNSTKLATTEYVKTNLGTVSAGTLTGTTLASTITGSSLTSLGTITSGTWSGTTISLANGGTGATTASSALSNLGAEAFANKSLDITADATSTTKYPSVKTIKDYVDLRVASAAVADGSLTNAKLVNSTTTLGSTTMTLGGTVTSVTGLTSVSSTGFTGALTGNASTASALATGKTISTTGDVTYTSGLFDGTSNVTGAATLTNTAVTAGSYGSSTAIPTFTVDSKGRLTAAGTVGIVAGVNALNYTSTTSYATGGTISGTSLTIAAADGTNPGLLSTGAQTIAGAKTFNSNIIGNLSGNATTATNAGNITATINTTLTSLANLNTVGTITSGVWSGTAIALANGGTGATTAAGARTNLGLGSLATSSSIANADVASTAAIDFSKLNITKANITGLGVQEGLTAGSGISIASGTISATGLTTNNLASNAAITNSQLANSITTLGSTTMTLGGTVTSVTGLTSVSSTGFTGALTGNASTATKLAVTKNINGIAFDGSADITIGAASNTLTGTTLASNIVNSSLTGVGTITSGTWSATSIDVAHGGTGLTSLTAGYIPYGNGTGSFGKTANLFWDNTNTRLGVGTSTPTTKLEVNGSFKAGGLTYPTTDGTAGQYLKTDGSGNLAFTSTVTLPQYTSTTRDAASLGLGSIIYNTTTGTIQSNLIDASGVATNSFGPTSGSPGVYQPGWSSSTQQNLYFESFKATSAVSAKSVSLNVYVVSGTSRVFVRLFNDSDPTNGLTNEVASGYVDVTSTSSNNIQTLNFATPFNTTLNAVYTALVYSADQSNQFYFGTFGSDVYTDGSYSNNQISSGNLTTISSNVSSISANTWAGSDLYIALNYGVTATKWVDGFMPTDLASNVSGTLPLINGGTGATTASGARNNLGLGALATKATIVNADVDASAAIAFSKLNITKANITGLGVQESLIAGSGISIASGTISATGLTTNNLASNAAITNSQLANSITTLGSTTMTLGGTVTSVTGLTSLTSTGFTGALTGNASTATKLAATKNINGTAFDGSADITIIADAGTLSGTTLKSTVTSSSLTGVGTITSGTWNGSTIAVANGGTGVTTSTGTGSVVLSTSPILVTPNIGAASGTSLSLSSALAAGASTFSSTINVTGATILSTLTASGNSTLTSLTATGAATFSNTVKITTGAAAGKVLTSDATGLATWQNSGGSITTMSATGTATSTATYIIFTGSTASQTITIPSAVTLGAGRELTIKNVASVSVSIASAGGFLIQDNTTLTSTGAALGIEPSNNWMRLVSDGTNWYIFRALF